MDKLKIHLCKVIVLVLPFGVYAQNKTDTNFLINHLQHLTKTEQYRNYQHPEQLNLVAAYLFTQFKQHSDSVSYQDFTADGNTYRNVICSFGTEHEKRIIVGAHYDVCGSQQGADDNASGVSGLLELARLLKGQKLNYRIDLVAYTLEEPPFYATKQMGSFVHAKWLKDNEIDVKGMISLEMIGYFDDARKSQKYPLSLLSLIYGSRGNYIVLVKKFGSGNFARRFTRKYRDLAEIKTKKFVAPKIIPGIDFSDHRNYWHFGFSALMITDTAFYRNTNYHQKTDTMEKLDIAKMALVIDGVLESLVHF